MVGGWGRGKEGGPDKETGPWGGGGWGGRDKRKEKKKSERAVGKERRWEQCGGRERGEGEGRRGGE